jgi:hypothetical protein
MILANSHGSILSNLNLKFFRNSINFKLLLNNYLIGKLLQCKQTGEVNMRNAILSLIRLVLLILCLVLMLINRMERPREKHKHIVEVELSLLAQAHMSLKYWDGAFLAATFLINRTPSKVINYSTPLECLFKVKPNF